ncbi:MAG: dihydropteroate synthase [Planctomycetota bacterium]|nr:MAG: dihydropteroate synthase [Planctomycetota bacterium]
MQHIHFITGRLAEQSLRSVASRLAQEMGFDYTIEVMPISVAALMSPAWIAKHWQPPARVDRVIIPGYCQGELTPLAGQTAATVERGPRDLRQLPAFFSSEPAPADYGAYDIQIVAEINHCPRKSLTDILAEADALARAGADVIDVGCEPGDVWAGVHDAVRALREAGHRVSIDSSHPSEIRQAVAAGAELVLSVNSANRSHALDWDVEVVAIPDVPETLEGLDETVEYLRRSATPMRIDPILEPISFGFAASLGRYLEVRRRYPEAEMLMGIGNLTELTDVDTAGVNALLLGFCQEIGVRSVLTTQVIHWARTSVRECDVARRLMRHAVEHRVLPKHIERRLLMLRGSELNETPLADIENLSRQVRDGNYRIYAAQGEIHLVAAGLHLRHRDPFAVMEQLSTAGPGGGLPKNLDSTHAFYLGYEMCKAATALALGKTYVQDEPLDWGLATPPEKRCRLKRTHGAARTEKEAEADSLPRET